MRDTMLLHKISIAKIEVWVDINRIIAIEAPISGMFRILLEGGEYWLISEEDYDKLLSAWSLQYSLSKEN